jgi:nitroimidazol reductase NimA-like FMN-containing flavoprotein (pyridoxamine 5'-phosphate oxidase superfamily)
MFAKMPLQPLEPATPANRWINTAEGRNPDRAQAVWAMLQANRFGTLATCSRDGWPWASPLLYGYDRDLTLYWSSAIVAQHSRFLVQNQGRATWTIYDSHATTGQVTGLFLTGRAHKVAPIEVEIAMELLFQRLEKRPDRTAADYLGDSPRRFYCFQPQRLWITGDRVATGNQLIDTKIELDLAIVRQLYPDSE